MAENPLGFARRQLDDAVKVMADRQPVWHDGVCNWSDSLYVRLRGAMRSSMKAGRRTVPGSRLPCHSGVLALLIDIDKTVATWQAEGVGTVDRLHKLRVGRFRPEDVDKIDGFTAQLGKWTVEAVELLGDKPVEIPLRQSCPACGRKFIYGPSNGDTVRRWALIVGENGARCLGCTATWNIEKLEFLAQLLQSIPGPGS